MKKILVTALSAAMLVTSVGLTACGSDDEELLSKFTLTETFVDDDFILPSTIGADKKEVSWTSSDTTSIEVTKRAEDWLADVKLGDDTKTVILTVKCGKATKSFEITVQALDVNYIAQKYNFKYDKASVFADFTLDDKFTIQGKEASLAWTIDQKYADYAKISADGKSCLVTESTIDTEIVISATFTYNSKTTTVPYRMTVSFEREHLQEVDYWYNNTGVSTTMSGYVVAIATEYSAQYGNVSLYMVDDDGCAGYYVYRLKTDNDNAALLKPGAHITVTNTTNTNYNGLIETNAGGNLVVDKDKSISAEEVAKKVYALDNDLLAKAPAAVYNESRLVSLEKWTVDSVAEKAPEAGSTGNLFTLNKGGIKVNVVVSKYLEGVYKTNKDDATWNALVALQGTIKAGDVISLKGLLGKKNGTYEIAPFVASDVKKEEGTASTIPTHVTNAQKAIAQVATVMDDNAGYTIIADKSFAVPTTIEGVEVSYKLLQQSRSVTIADGNIAIKAGKEDKAYIEVTYTAKDGDTVLYTTKTFHTIHSKSMTDAQVVDNVIFDFEMSETEIVSNMDLITTIKQFPGVNISWEILNTSELTGVSISTNGKTLLVTPSTAKEMTVKLKATVTYGTASDTIDDIVVKVLKVNPVATGTFVLGLQQVTLGKKLYFTGVNDKGYGTTTEKFDEAAKIQVAEVEGGYTLKVGDKFLELTDKHKLTLVDTTTGAWKYDHKLKVFTWTVEAEGGKIYYLGAYGTFDTISASETKYISGSNADNVGKTQFVVECKEVK